MKLENIYSPGAYKILLSLFILLVFSSCKKAVDIGPSPVSLNGSNVYTSNSSAQSVLSGLFSKMAGINGLYNGQNSMSLSFGLAADELTNYSTSSITFSQFYSNNLTNQSSYFWPEIYNEIYVCNTAVKGLADLSTPLSSQTRQQLTGEAKFVRAFLYFYAVNAYGDVPLTITNNYLDNNVIARSPKIQVYQQIIQDLKDAQSLLSDNQYVTGTGVTTTDRVRPNKQTATALLARVYLYQQDWQNAATQASAVIGSSTYLLEPKLDQVFLKASREAIWQLQPVIPGSNNGDAFALVVTATPGQGAVTQLPLTSTLISAFEKNDARLLNWIGIFNAPANGNAPAASYYYANKYKNYLGAVSIPVTEYPIIFRLAEQYLIRAEARAHLGDINGTQADLNAIRTRAGLPGTTAVTTNDLLAAVAHERQTELFTEWGHRWFDLIRTGRIDAVMAVVAPQKGTVWNSTKQLMPIPASDILADPQLIQNPGY